MIGMPFLPCPARDDFGGRVFEPYHAAMQRSHHLTKP
jgi:hypothetical protein